MIDNNLFTLLFIISFFNLLHLIPTMVWNVLTLASNLIEVSLVWEFVEALTLGLAFARCLDLIIAEVCIVFVGVVLEVFISNQLAIA